jgi:hypothetical protein
MTAEKFASLPAMERERIRREAEAAEHYATAKAAYEALEVDVNRIVAQRFASNLLQSWAPRSDSNGDVRAWDTAWYLIVVAETERMNATRL